MNPPTSPTPSDYFGFANLNALQAAHARLVRQQGATPLPADFLLTVEGFVLQAQATGRLLGDEEERTSAQTIIDYWVTVLLRGRRKPPETGLAEFGFHTSKASIRGRSTSEYLTEERIAIRKRLRLSAAAAQWNDSERDRSLLWGGSELTDAEKHPDLTELEKEFIAAGFAYRTRAARIRQTVLGFILTLLIGGLVLGLCIQRRYFQDTQHQLAMTLVERAAVLMREGDVAGSLLWSAQALREDHQAGHDEAMHRIRIGSAMAQLPDLLQVMMEENADRLCSNAIFSADGKSVLTISNPRNDKVAQIGVARLWDAETGKMTASFSVPDAKVTAAVFGKDGRILTVSGSSPRIPAPDQVRLWQSDGTPSGEFTGITGRVLFAVTDTTGARVAMICAGADGKPAVAEVRTLDGGSPLTLPLEWQGEVRGVAFSPDGNYVAVWGSATNTGEAGAAGGLGQVKVWSAWKSEMVSKGEMKHDLPVNWAAFAPDSSQLVTGTGDPRDKRGTVEVWQIFSGPPTYSKERTASAERLFAAAHDARVVSVCFSPDGRRVLSASHDETARVWDARTGAPLLEFQHESSVYQAAYSPDGRTIVSVGRDQVARVWSVATGRAAVPPLCHSQTVSRVSFSPDGKRVLTSTSDGARIWQLQASEPPSPILQLKDKDPVWQTAISADGMRVVAASRSGAFGTWERKEGWKLRETAIPSLGRAGAIFFSADASLALVFADRKVRLFNPQDPAAQNPVPQEITLDEGVLSFAAFSPDRSRILLASGTGGSGTGGTLIWDRSPAKPVRLKTAGVVTYAVFSEDGKRVLTAGGTRNPPHGEARVWNVATGEPVSEVLDHAEEITHASFSPDGTHVITASVDDTAKIWTITPTANAPKEPVQLSEHSADLSHASFSPDGKIAVTASYDRTAVLWAVATGKRISVLQHRGLITDAEFSHDGRLLVTACSDQTARVWEVATGDWVALFRHDGQVASALFSADDQSVVTLSSYEPANTLREAQRGVPPVGSGSTEPAREQDNQRSMLRAQAWRLTSASGSVAVLHDFAQLMRSREIARTRDLIRLPRTRFSALWAARTLLPGHADGDTPAASSLAAVEESEATSEWFAVKWHLDQLLKADPDNVDLLERRGLAHGHLRRWEDAVRDYEHVATLSYVRPVLLRLARANVELGRFDEAIRHTTSGIDLPQSAASSDTSKSERSLRMLRAESYAAQGLWENAAADLLKAIELRPDLPSAYQRLAAVRLKQGQPAEYQRLCEKMIELSDPDVGLGGIIAWACALREGAVSEPDKPVKLADRALADEPTSFYAMNTLAAALYRAGRYPEALTKLKESSSTYLRAASLAHERGEADAVLMPIQEGRTADWIFLAMTHHRLSQTSAATDPAVPPDADLTSKRAHAREARELLKKARESITSKTIHDPRRTWYRIEMELLLQEAETLLGPAPEPL